MNLRNQLSAILRSSESDPQARDSRHDAWGASTDFDIAIPDRAEIGDWVSEYKANPLVHVPVDKFASDVAEPGYRVDLDLGEDDDVPTVPDDHPEYGGEGLDEALEQWLGTAAIVAGEFDRDFSDLIQDVVKDLRGKRGTALCEHAYNDREDRDSIRGLRLFKVETVTAYTREGKAILLKDDDDAEDAVPAGARGAGTFSSGDRRTVPETAAGNTAAYVQYDDQFGTSSRSEVALAQSDVTKLVHNADTGEVFGEPEQAMVHAPAKGVREQIETLKKGLMGKMFGYWYAQVGTEKNPVSEEEGKKLVKDMALNDPQSVTSVPYQVQPKKHEGEVPDVENVFNFQIEYVLSAFAAPIYRIGFAGDINRDISTEQKEDYRSEVRRQRDQIESAFHTVLNRKAVELMGNDPFEDFGDVDVPTAHLRIEPEKDESPLRDEQFDASAFRDLMQGLESAAPGGETSMIFPPEAIIEHILKMDPEEVIAAAPNLPDDIDEDDPEVEETFNRLRASISDPVEVGD